MLCPFLIPGWKSEKDKRDFPDFLKKKFHIEIIYLKLFGEKKCKKIALCHFLGDFWVFGVPFFVLFFVTRSNLVGKLWNFFSTVEILVQIFRKILNGFSRIFFLTVHLLLGCTVLSHFTICQKLHTINNKLNGKYWNFSTEKID